MKLVFVAIAFAVAPLIAQAQSALDVKGVALGATRAHVEAGLTHPTCEPGDPAEGPVTTWCRNSFAVGGDFNTSPDSFAGQPASIVYHLVGDKVGEITVAGLRADNYTAVLDALTAKYGAPKITHPSVKTRGGATFENTVATWTRGTDEIVYDRYGRTMEVSWLRFTSGAFSQEQKRWQAARASRAASDM